MDWIGLLRATFALALVLGLILGLSFLLRRYGGEWMAKMNSQRGEKRLKIVESLVLDPTRRLLLIRVDEQERLLLLGEGRELLAPLTEAHIAHVEVATPAPPATVETPQKPVKTKPSGREHDPVQDLF